MSTKAQMACCIGVLLVGVAIGRFTLPAKVITQTKLVQVVDDTKSKDTTKSDHTVTTITKKPDGTTVTVVQNDVQTDTKAKDIKVSDTTSESTKTVTYNTNAFTISAIALGQPLSSNTVSYGAELQYRVLGPIQAGVMGTSNGTFGLSLGISF